MDFPKSSPIRKTIPKIASGERLHIKGGRIVNSDLTTKADIFVENGVIRQVGNDLTIPGGVTCIDATGALIVPGGIDLAVEFDNNPVLDDVTVNDVTSVDNCYSASRAALLGGTTTIVSFSTGEKGKLVSSFNKKSEACEASCCDVSLHVDVTSWDDDVKEAMTKLSINHGVNTFRVFMSGQWQLTDEELYDVLKHIREIGCVALVHAENGSIIKKEGERLLAEGNVLPENILKCRNEKIEAEAINRALTISNQVDCPLLFWNVTGRKAIDLINKARTEGQTVYGQALAVALVQDGSVYSDPSWNKAASCVTRPPLRKNGSENIMNALAGGALQFVSSGHSVYNDHDKVKLGRKNFMKIPPGTNGVYERMMAVWTTGVEKGKIDENQFVSLTSTNAARFLNLYPRKGRIAVGSDADLVVWKVNEALSLAETASEFAVTKPDCTSAFEGVESKGRPSVVVAHGKVVYNDGQISVVQSMGDMVERPVCSPSIYNRLTTKDALHKTRTAPTPDSALFRGINGIVTDNTGANKVTTPERFSRGSGHRAMHQSGWSFSGGQAEDSSRPSSRFSNPPGGQSHISLT
uniref:dihydropyrimidinase-related protein 2 n=1 Tax=Ciona intestinalis TaxID=7719 RepID=UPI000521CD74|nr:dihydropyrimidinase-related protein 2 [Ciona intestinalis]|eukprot:XP_009857716.1 dihydropyrimidinase-related protein 2 [Ciona intestinalis]